ncbi:hypothetical protein CBS76997_3368 [Aspergillus niger]|nr:hypothetical protein CBS13152_6064 [Aspergillus niger]KAI3048049.1 hypothetical protein CBS76997_3368 [Aspergillus niger]
MMLSPSEQVVVYGRTLNPEYESLDMLDYTAGLDTVFAALILFFFVAVNWQTIASTISFGAKLLAAIFSPLEFFVSRFDAFKRWMATSQMERRVSDLCKWYFPSRRPIAMAFWVFATLVTINWTCQDLLAPSYHFLYGVVGGMGPAGWDHWEYCLNLDRGSPAGRWSNSRRLQGFHCVGVDIGVELFSVLEDHIPTFSVGDDIEHLRIFRFVGFFFTLASIIALAVIGITQSSLFKAIKMLCWTRIESKNGPEDEVQPQDTALPEQVELLSAKIGTYEAMLEEVRGQLAAKTEQVNRMEERSDELQSTNQMLAARDEKAKVAQQEDLIIKLRQELDRVNCLPIMANGRARAHYKSDSREQTLANRVAELEKQLAMKTEADANSRGIIESLQAELQVRTEEANAIASRLVTVEAQKLRTAEEEVLRKDTEIRELQERLQVQEDQSYERAMELSAAEDQLTSQDVLIHDLQERIRAQEAAPQAQATEELHTAEKVLQMKVAEIQDLEGQLQFYQAQCQMQAAHLGEAEEQVNGLRAQLGEYHYVVEQLRLKEEELRVLKGQFEKLEGEGREKQEELDYVSVQYDSLFEDHVYLQTRLEGDEAAQENLGLRAEVQSLRSALDGNNAAQEALDLRVEVNAVKAFAEEKVREAEERMMEAEAVANALRQADRGLRETMQGLKKAYDDEVERYDDEVEKERAAANEARKQVKGLAEELKEMSQQVGIALRDAQRFQEQKEGTEAEMDKLEGVNDVLEHRLKYWERSESSQEIPKRRTGDLGSLATALDSSRVEISRQQTEINRLHALLRQAQTESAASAPSVPSDQALRDSVNRLRQALEAEKRQRTEEQVRWGRRVRELEEETQRLRVSSSNAGLGRGRGRGGGG